MLTIIMILLSVMCEVVIANSWLIIPDICRYVLWGLTGFVIMTNVINYLVIRSHIKSIKKGMNGHMNEMTNDVNSLTNSINRITRW